MDIEEKFKNHIHNWIDSQKIRFKKLSLTTKNSTTLSTGGSAVLSTSDSTVIANMRTRINEIETFLKTL